MNTKIVPRPARSKSPEQEARLQQMIGSADNLSEPAPAAAAAPAAPAPAPVAEVPLKLRKRKVPITVTVDGAILEDFDQDAEYLGLSRAGALGMAMKMWSEEQRKRRGA